MRTRSARAESEKMEATAVQVEPGSAESAAAEGFEMQ
jgi:hypothetical protein